MIKFPQYHNHNREDRIMYDIYHSKIKKCRDQKYYYYNLAIILLPRHYMHLARLTRAVASEYDVLIEINPDIQYGLYFCRPEISCVALLEMDAWLTRIRLASVSKTCDSDRDTFKLIEAEWRIYASVN